MQGSLPPPPAALADAEAQQLLELLRHARADQRRETARAVEQALHLVPRVLRGTVRRAVGA